MDDSVPDVDATSGLPVADRSGTAWTDDQHRRLVAGLVDGLTVGALAEEFGRSTGAIRSRARLMVPVDEQRVGGETAVRRLRELLAADPGYDWQAALTKSMRTKGTRSRTDAATARLLEAWEAGAPTLPDLARELGHDEAQLVRHLMTLRLADSLVEVVDRLGCSPDGLVEQRYRFARDVASASAWVLTVYGIPGSPGHISLHRTEAEAAARRDELFRTGRGSDSSGALAWWCIAHRSPGADNSGPSRQGTAVVGTSP